MRHDYEVKSIEEIVEQYKGFKVVILSSMYYEEIKKDWLKYIPENSIVPKNNIDTRVHFNYFEEQYKKWIVKQKKRISSIYESLADETSKKSFYMMLIGAEHYSAYELMNICNISLTEDPDYFHNFDFIRLTDCEDYLDVGAYDGDTVRSFVRATNGRYNSILAIEPDGDLYNQLENTCKSLKSGSVDCMRVGLSDKNAYADIQLQENKYMNTVIEKKEGKLELRTIDSLDSKTLIKISVYDPKCRCNIIRGGVKTLAKDKPKLIIQIERHSDAILDIPEEIWKTNPKYDIYFRIMLYEQKGILRFNMAYWAI